MNCWVCGSGARFGRLELRDADRGAERFSALLCAACRSGSLVPPPSPAVLSAYYDAAYYGPGSAKFAAPLQLVLDWSNRLHARPIMRLLRGNSRPRVLDIGCGRGTLLAELVSRGARGVGLERTALASQHRQPDLELRVGELAAQGFADASFDTVVLWHVLEHLDEPRATLAEIGRILRPGGLLVIAVPNNASWQARLFGRHWFHADAPRHLHFFGHQGLLDAMQREGYDVLASGTLDAVQNTFGFIQSCLNLLPFAAPNRLYRLMRGGRSAAEVMQLLAWSLAALPLLPFALVEAAVAASLGQGACSTMFARRQ